MRAFALACVLALTACAETTSNHEATLKQWIGHTEELLVHRWGPPDNIYDSSGTRVLTYTDSRQTAYQMPVMHWDAYSGRMITTYEMVPDRLHCRTDFYISDGAITHARYEGNAC